MKIATKYNPNSIKSIFEYSKGLLDHTLYDFSPDDYQCRKGKGGLGEMVEEIRLLNSPASQRGRDFAIILASLSDLGYTVEWRIINAAEYGMPQRRRRTYIVAYHNQSKIYKEITDLEAWVMQNGVVAQAFPCAFEI